MAFLLVWLDQQNLCRLKKCMEYQQLFSQADCTLHWGRRRNRRQSYGQIGMRQDDVQILYILFGDVESLRRESS